MQRTAITLAEGRRHPALNLERLAPGRPTVVNARHFLLNAKELHAVVSPHDNEQTAVGAVFLAMKDGPQAGSLLTAQSRCRCPSGVSIKRTPPPGPGLLLSQTWVSASISCRRQSRKAGPAHYPSNMI
jgi:hypothetical protein